MSLQNHLHKRSDSTLQVRDNYAPIELMWEDEVRDEAIAPMPMLRRNYKDLEVGLVAYMAQLDMLDSIERNMKWENVFTSL